MTKAQAFSYFEFEACIAHFKAHPPVGGQIELDFTADEIQQVRDWAARYDCTIDVFLTAVVACLETERLHRAHRKGP